MQVGLEQIASIEGLRVVVIAGGKQDDVEGVREMGRLLSVRCKESKAFVVREAVHG